MNADLPPKCAYCGEGNLNPSNEHVIPNAMGGSLQTREVCEQCNNTMGSDVDAPFSDSLLLRLLRYNFKDYLPNAAIPNFALDAELVSPDQTDRIPGRIHFSARGIEFELTFETRTQGNEVTYFMPDTPQGRRAFEGILNSQNRTIVDSGWIDLPPHAESFLLAGPGFVRYQRPLIKMLLGFIAAEVSLALACDQRFDAARQFLQGEIQDLSAEGYGMRTGVTNAAIELSDSVGHEIGFKEEDGYRLFSVTLFDALLFQVVVDDQLPVLPMVYRTYTLNRRRRTLGVPLFRLLPP